VLLTGLFIVACAALAWRLIAIRRCLRRRRTPPAEMNRCVCGYDLNQLDTIRCPECGRVEGFDVTAEELQLTPQQLQLVKAKREARRQSGAW
jgi:hypothetical protein